MVRWVQGQLSRVCPPVPGQKTVMTEAHTQSSPCCGRHRSTESLVSAGRDKKLEWRAVHSRETTACRPPRGLQQTRGDRVQCPQGTGPGTGVVPTAEPREKGEPVHHSQHEPKREHRFPSGSFHLKRDPMSRASFALELPVRQVTLLVPATGRRNRWRMCQAAHRASNVLVVGTTLRNQNQGGKSLPEVSCTQAELGLTLIIPKFMFFALWCMTGR